MVYDLGQMEKTTLYFAADHGYVGLFGIYKILQSNDWIAEYSLPILIIIENDKKNVSYENQYGDILKNQQNLVTPFDIYFTLSHNLYGINYTKFLNNTNVKNGQSLFKYINPKDRTCTKYEIPQNECRCKNF